MRDTTSSGEEEVATEGEANIISAGERGTCRGSEFSDGDEFTFALLWECKLFQKRNQRQFIEPN